MSVPVAASSPATNPLLRILGWTAVSALGGASVAMLAWSRGEPVNALWMVTATVCVFAVSYRFHSAWLMARVLTLDEQRATPAAVHEDGKDFVKTNKWVVFGHHFAAIAGPGPLVGPVLAAQFGFLPGMLWILVGATLGGAVHDSVVMFCSVRRGGKSLGQMVREEVGPFAGFLALISIIPIMVILLAVLALVVVKALAESPWGLFTIAATMPIALAMGLGMRAVGHGGRGLAVVSALGVIGLLAAVWGGQFISGTPLEAMLTLQGHDARLVADGLRAARLGAAGLAAARAARLPEHLHENRHGGGARARGDRAGAGAAGCRRSPRSSTAPVRCSPGPSFPSASSRSPAPPCRASTR
jgi:carbon starvation protein